MTDLKAALQGVMEALGKMTTGKWKHEGGGFINEAEGARREITRASLFFGLGEMEWDIANGRGIVALKNFLDTHGAALLGLVEENERLRLEHSMNKVMADGTRGQRDQLRTLLEQRTQEITRLEKMLKRGTAHGEEIDPTYFCRLCEARGSCFCSCHGGEGAGTERRG